MPSDFINRKLVQTIFHAFDFAKYIGKPLNMYVVLNLRFVDTDVADKAMQAIRHKCRDWLQRKQRLAGLPVDPPYYVYSFENPSGALVHVNWVLHVPPEFAEEFRRKLPGWLKKVQGGAMGPRDVDVRDVDPRTDKSLAKYILKGTDPVFVPHFHLEDYAQEPQGSIYGRRAGASVALNKSARDAAGFVAKRHRHVWKQQAWARSFLAMPLQGFIAPIAASQVWADGALGG